MPPGFFSQGLDRLMRRPPYALPEEEAARTPGINPSAAPSPMMRPAPLPRAPWESPPVRLPNPERVKEVDDPLFGTLEYPVEARRPPTVQPAMGIPGGAAPTGPIATMRPEGPGAQLREAQDVWNAGYRKPQGFFGRIGNALSAAGRGAVEGLKSGEGIVPGALRQGVIAGVDPMAEREIQFNQRIRPKILERIQMDQADQAQRSAQAQQILEAQKGQLELEKLKGEINKPVLIPAGTGVMRPGEKVPGYTQPDKPERPQSLLSSNAPAIYDPSTGKWIQNPYYQPGNQEIYSSTEGGVLNRRTGEVNPNPYARDRSATQTIRPKESLDVETDFNKLKVATDAAGQKLALAKQAGKEEEIQEAQIEYNKAFQAENDYAISAARNYPEDFEGGPGTGGRAYVKRKQRPERLPRASSGTTGGRMNINAATSRYGDVDLTP